MSEDLTLEDVETIQLLYLNSFIDENDIRKEYGKWLEQKGMSVERGTTQIVLEQFIEDLDLKDHFRKWLVATYREDMKDKCSQEDIERFINLLEVK